MSDCVNLSRVNTKNNGVLTDVKIKQNKSCLVMHNDKIVK